MRERREMKEKEEKREKGKKERWRDLYGDKKGTRFFIFGEGKTRGENE